MSFGNRQTAPLRQRTLFLLLCALMSNPALALDTTAPESLKVIGASAVDVPFTDIAGPLRAGKLCFPNGKVRVRDFVSGQRAFGVMVTEAVDGLNSDHKARLSALKSPVSVHLVGITAKLCAKNWGGLGFGDKRSLAGEAAFAFEVGMVRNDATVLTKHQVTLKLKGAEALPPPEILHSALVQLLADVADHPRPQ